jgi:hypothetical protein
MEQRLRLRSQHKTVSTIPEGEIISFLPLFSIYSLQLSIDLLGSILIWIGILLAILLAIGGYLIYRYAKSNMHSRRAFMTATTADISTPKESDIQSGSMIFPRTCPSCHERLDFSRIIWANSKSGKCHNCGTVIEAKQ